MRLIRVMREVETLRSAVRACSAPRGRVEGLEWAFKGEL